MIRKYHEKIDGLRFVAITLVLIEHFSFEIGHKISAGYYGVDLFFVISGFLITQILLGTTGNFLQSYKNFIGRRVLRIFPIYYLTILLLLLFKLDVVKDYLIFFLTYTFNYAMVYYSMDYTPVNHFWSLCVEEQFYIFWPIVVLLLRDNGRALVLLLILMIVASFSQITFGIFEAMNRYNTVSLLTRMGSLGFGGLAALLYQTNNIPERFFKSGFVEFGMLLILLVSLLVDFSFRYPLLACCSFYLVIKIIHSDFKLNALNNFLKNKVVVFIGSISYGVYIYHLPLGYYFSKYVYEPIWTNSSLFQAIDSNGLGVIRLFRWQLAWIIQLPLYSGLSILVAYFSYKYIEKPLLNLKDKYFSYN